MKPIKLGYQAHEKYRNKHFHYIEINDFFTYCNSHNFVFNSKEEMKKLYKGQPCFYTDIRYAASIFNSYGRAYIYYGRKKKPISLKACKRRILKVRNIPIGTIIDFNKDWYVVGKNVDLGYKFRIRKENNFNPNYEISKDSFFEDFTACKFSRELTRELRKNGFIVMVKTDSFDNTEYAVAYGFDKQIGYSVYNEPFCGYSSGRENILWDLGEEFDKWSRCNQIPKTTSINDIIKQLKE